MCTGIGLCYKNKCFIGKNHDWVRKDAYIVINPRKMINHAPLYKHQNKLLSWKSKYGSITVNLTDQNNVVVPGVMAGMNEKGLAVLTLWLAQSEYPSVKTKTVVPTELFAKYFLDNAKNVQEAIKLFKKIDVEPSILSTYDTMQLAKILRLDTSTIGNINVHLYLQDEKGETAIIKYLNKKQVVHSGKQVKIFAITNDPYSDSIEYIKQFKGFGGNAIIPSEFDSEPAFANSLQRFARVANALKIMPKIEAKQQAVSYAFNALAYTQNPLPNTQWTSVFDLSDRTLYLRSIDNQQIRIVRLSKFNISEGQPIKILSINNDLSGYVENKFKVLKTKL